MISLTDKEKKLNLFLLLPFYFLYGQFLFMFVFLAIGFLLGMDMTDSAIDSYFNLVYMTFLAVASFLIFHSYLKKSWDHMKGKWLKQIGYACTAGIAKFYFFNVVSSLIILLINPNSSSANQEAIIEMAASSPIFMLITTVLLAPFVEEMIFRVGIFQMFYHKNRILAYLLGSLSFGFVHIMGGLFMGDFTQILFLLPYSLLGYALCNIYEKRDSIFVPMIVHMLNNLVAMIAIL